MPANRALFCEVGAMGHDNAIPISVVALRAEDYSPDGKHIILSLTTKYSAAERKYAVPVECFQDLIVDLRRLNAASPAAIEPSRSTGSPRSQRVNWVSISPAAIEPSVQPADATDLSDSQNRLTIAA